MTIKKNDEHVIKITDISAEGMGIGRLDGFAIFVEGALPSELVKIIIVKVKKAYAFGKLLEIIDASAQRVEPSCTNKGCGGCNIQHLKYESQLEYKTKKVKAALQRIGKIDVDVLDTIGSEKQLGYRNKAQFPVGIVNGNTEIGFYSARSHRLVAVSKCVIQGDACNEIIDDIKAVVSSIAVYDESKHEGIIRHVIIRTSETTGEVMVIFVINSDCLPNSNEIVDRLKKHNNITSINISINKKKTNAILGNKFINIYGNDYITEVFNDGGLTFRISPHSFFQVNTLQAQVLYRKVLELAALSVDEIVVDLYCGTGTIALFLAAYAKKVYGVEIVEAAINDANANASMNNISNVEFVCSSAEDALESLAVKPDLIVLDPPRAGCDASVINCILKVLPKKIIYVSCDPATLARDLSLVKHMYNVAVVQPVDMFPNIWHVETVVLMTRKDGC